MTPNSTLPPASSVAQLLRQYLEAQIASGQYPMNSWLPSVRDLAVQMGVNRNTVSKVYQSLARDGVVEVVRGKGVRCLGSPGPTGSSADRLNEAINSLVRQAAAMGLSQLWLRETVDEAARDTYGKQLLRIGFVECNDEDTTVLSRDLSNHLGVPVTPILLADLSAATFQVANLDIIATTLYHLQEVTDLIGLAGVELVGINHELSYESILEIARIKTGARIAVVCPNERTLDRVQRIVAMYARGELVKLLADDPQLKARLAQAEIVVATSGSRRAFADLDLSIPVIVVRFHIQDQSIAYLQSVVRAYAHAPKSQISRRADDSNRAISASRRRRRPAVPLG